MDHLILRFPLHAALYENNQFPHKIDRLEALAEKVAEEDSTFSIEVSQFARSYSVSCHENYSSNLLILLRWRERAGQGRPAWCGRLLPTSPCTLSACPLGQGPASRGWPTLRCEMSWIVDIKIINVSVPPRTDVFVIRKLFGLLWLLLFTYMMIIESPNLLLIKCFEFYSKFSDNIICY